MAAIQTLTLQRQYVLSHHRDTEGPLIADWRLRISDLELMNTFSIRTIRNPKSAITTGSPCISVYSVVVRKNRSAGFQPAKVVLTQKELSRLRCRRDAGATIFSHNPCLRGEKRMCESCKLQPL